MSRLPNVSRGRCAGIRFAAGRISRETVPSESIKASSAEKIGRLLASMVPGIFKHQFKCPAQIHPACHASSELPGVVQDRPSTC